MGTRIKLETFLREYNPEEKDLIEQDALEVTDLYMCSG